MKAVQIQSIKPKTDYREIIQINVPIRFFWNPDGSFDGVEFTFAYEITEWEQEMLDDCLEAIAPAIGIIKE